MGNVHSVVVGKGRPLIFLPAVGFTGIEGLTIAEALANQYESHLLDMPGAGKSSGITGKVNEKKIALWIKSYLDELGFKKVVLVGHSMGAGLALCFASHYPEYVERLVMIDFGHRKVPLFPVSDMGPLGYAFPIINLMYHVAGNFISHQLKKVLSADDSELTNEQQEEEVKSFCQRFNLVASPQVRQALEDNADFTIEGFRLLIGMTRINFPKLLMRSKVPTLLIYATFDSFDKKRAKKIQKAVQRLDERNMFLHLIGLDGHHYLHWECPETIEEIKNFLEI
jgi:2-hydroxy-6-oxonona-2,4-dienedioate hydrolase